MKKPILLTPGPTPIPDSVLAAMNRPIVYHRSAGFQSLFEEVRSQLKAVFQTKGEVLTLSCSGTGAMEAAVTNLFRAGDVVITLNTGKFGERWTKLARTYGLNTVEIKVEPGNTIDIAQVEEAFQANPTAKAVLFQASETSTGVRLPTQEIAKLCREKGALSVCDAITALAVFDLPMDAWGIDVLITGSQKALMVPPGLAFIALSETAWKANETSTLPKFYFDLARERKSQAKNQTAWTPAISLVQGLQESLRMIREEGLHNVFKRHELLAKATRAAMQAMKLELLAKKSFSTAVTAIRVPAEIKDGKMIPRTMRDRYGVTIAGGQDELEGKIFRLSHFGYCERFDVLTGIECLELTLKELGYPSTSASLGAGTSAALQVFSEA